MTEEKKIGKCKECGRKLTNPRSVAVGYGPVCYRKLFKKEQPLLPGERARRSRKKKRGIDTSNMADLNELFGILEVNE